MANTNDVSWPKTSSGTIDWEVVFEDPENGLIPLISKAETAEALRESTLIVIWALFGGKGDSANRKKYVDRIDKIISVRGGKGELAMKATSINNLLRQVKTERVYLAGMRISRLNAGGNPKRTVKPDRQLSKTRLLIRAIANRPVRSALLGLLLVGLFVSVAMIVWRYERVEPARYNLALESALKRGSLNLPNAAWKVTSVTKGGGNNIYIHVEVSDSRQVSKIKGVSRMDRLQIMKLACPAPSSPITDFVRAGGKVWVNLESQNETLTSGTCKY